MKLFLQGHSYRYSVEQMMLALFPSETVEFVAEKPTSDECCAICSLSHGKKFATARTEIIMDGRKSVGIARFSPLDPGLDPVNMSHRIVRLSFYKAAVPLLPEKPPWGALAGVRPTKIVTAHLNSGGNMKTAEKLLKEVYDVNPDRIRLCMDTAGFTRQAQQALGPKDISLYIGIPFCPTRCAYCSFVSASVEKLAHLVGPYLNALFEELDYAASIVGELGLQIRSVYIGGGTPTTLSGAQMDDLMGRVFDKFALTGLLEYTVEAGRPDTITTEKLQVMKKRGATRISVNPQTMNDSVLKNIGRSHSAYQVEQAVAMTRDAGFSNINMDLIAGLPGDDTPGFMDSLHRVLAFEPSNITIHTLSLKRGSSLTAHDERAARETGSMLKGAEEALRKSNYLPYYLYRQKYSAGGFENTGWCKPGQPGLYNIFMMEELHTILSLGAGGSTKLVCPETKVIRRAFNPKYPQDYIAGIEKVKQNKELLQPLRQSEE